MCALIFGTLGQVNNLSFTFCVSKRLTSQPSAIDKSLMPIWGLDIEEVEEHVQDDLSRLKRRYP